MVEGPQMTVLKTLIAIEGTNEICRVDTIQYEGKLWLVPEWLESPTQGWKKPKRIILLDGLQYQRLRPGDLRGNFLLNAPIPRAVIDGRAPNAEDNGYVVIETPLGVQVPIPRGIH
jgi:hypothetical protein